MNSYNLAQRQKVIISSLHTSSFCPFLLQSIQMLYHYGLSLVASGFASVIHCRYSFCGNKQRHPKPSGAFLFWQVLL